MANFMFVYRGGNDDPSSMSPEQMQQLMQRWNDWISKGYQSGWMVDAGDALTPEGRVINSKHVVTDGPFVESKEVIGGYSIVQADGFEKACEIAKCCPALLYGGSIEVRQCAGLAPKK
jgi:hypothetical protein